MKIAFLHKDNDFTAELLRELKSRNNQHEIASWIIGEPAPANDFEFLITLGKVGPDELQGQSKLAFIQTASTGYEAVDQDAATEQGIWVSFAPSDVTGNATSVAEFAVLLMLGAARHLNQFLQPARQGSGTISHIQPALSGKTVCVVGLGAIGEQLIDRLRPFDMKIVATDEHPEHAPKDVTAYPAGQLSQALAGADFVVICVRASKENENLIDAAAFAAMKRGVILINIARGTLIDEAALLVAVQSGQVAAAGLDVLQVEPPEAGNPLMAYPQILITPHIAGFTDLMLRGTVSYLGEVIAEVEAGRKPKSVLNNPEAPRVALI